VCALLELILIGPGDDYGVAADVSINFY